MQLSAIAYGRLSGHDLSSPRFDLALKLASTAAIADATLLHESELWSVLSEQVAGRVEAVHTRWLRKVTGEFRSVAECRSSDQDVRITYDVPSTWSQLAYKRLR